MGSSQTSNPPIQRPPPHVYKIEEFKELMKRINLLNGKKSHKNYMMSLTKEDYNEYENFIKKYSNYQNIERFCIPIIGVINSGKSTFLNYLLNLCFLQMGENETTKFISIIRHKEEAIIPEIYEVEIKKRDDNAFNFYEKGDNLLSSSDPNKVNEILLEIIRKRNEDIKNKEDGDKNNIEPENYFLIIRVKIPLFENEYKKYSNFIDFLDIPGLDSTKRNVDGFDDFIKIIFKNILFPVFLSDVLSFENEQLKKLIIKFLNYFYEINPQYENTFNNIFFILNKIDLVKNENDKEKLKNKFKKNFSNIEIVGSKKINIPINENEDLISISAENLYMSNEQNIASKIILEIISNAIQYTGNNFKVFAKKFLKENYNIIIPNSNNIQGDENLNSKLQLINHYIKKKCQGLDGTEFDLKEYTYLSNQRINLNMQNDEKVKEMLLKKIKSKFDEFLSFEFDELYSKLLSIRQIQKN